MLKKATAVLIVEAIEPCLPCWTALGMKKENEVPDEASGKLGFVILSGGTAGSSLELMYQTAASVAKDAGAALASAAGKTHLFVEVDDLAPVKSALAGGDVFLAERTTPYGSREIGYREPGGHFVTFAAFG
jgi:hypothetical protein